MPIKLESIKNIGLILLFRIVLDICYVYSVAPLWGYRGAFLDIDTTKLIESYASLVLVLLLIAKRPQKISEIIIHILTLMIYIPIISFYALANQARPWFYLTSCFWCILIIVSKIKINKAFPIVKARKIIFNTLSVSLPLISLVLIFIYLGVTINVNLNEVYNIREVYSEASIPFSGYLVNWSAKIVLPMLVLVALNEKKHYLLVISILAEFYLFSSTGHKTYLFAVPVALGTAYLVKKRFFARKISVMLTAIIISCLVASLLFEYHWLVSLFLHRTFVVPAQLSFYYYDFFRDNYLFLSHSFLKALTKYPYDMSIPNIIGGVYMNDYDTYANNGIVADAYMNFGVLGIIVWPIILAFVLKLMDIVTIGKNKNIVYPLLLLSSISLINGALFTSFLTDGILLCVVLVYLLPQNVKRETCNA